MLRDDILIVIPDALKADLAKWDLGGAIYAHRLRSFIFDSNMSADVRAWASSFDYDPNTVILPPPGLFLGRTVTLSALRKARVRNDGKTSNSKVWLDSLEVDPYEGLQGEERKARKAEVYRAYYSGEEKKALEKALESVLNIYRFSYEEQSTKPIPSEHTRKSEPDATRSALGHIRGVAVEPRTTGYDDFSGDDLLVDVRDAKGWRR